MTEVKKIFTPRFRALFDILLTIWVGGLIIHTLGLPLHHLVAALVIVTIALLILWFFVITPIVQVVIFKDTIAGPSNGFSRHTMLLRKIDHYKSQDDSKKSLLRGFHDIWSMEGKRIRLYRRLLGKSQIGMIFAIVEQYPFRETSAPAPPKTN